MKPDRTKILGIYLIAICALQICLYFVIYFVAAKEDFWLLYFEPRVGTIVIIELFFRSTQQIVGGIFRAISVVWILALGLLMLSGRPLIKTYIVSEIFLALPSWIVFFIILVIGGVGLSSANPETAAPFLKMVFIPILVAIFFTVIPLGLAFWLLLSSWFKREKKIYE